MTPEISEHLDNNRIIAEIFADYIKQARKLRYPSAEELAELPVERIR